jgi:hypothetical protein
MTSHDAVNLSHSARYTRAISIVIVRGIAPLAVTESRRIECGVRCNGAGYLSTPLRDLKGPQVTSEESKHHKACAIF